MAPVTVASSLYQLPTMLADIATDEEAVVESNPPGHRAHEPRHADFVVYRTPDYLISACRIIARANSSLRRTWRR